MASSDRAACVCVYSLFILLVYKGNRLSSLSFGLRRGPIPVTGELESLVLVSKWDYNRRFNYSYRILYLYFETQRTSFHASLSVCFLGDWTVLRLLSVRQSDERNLPNGWTAQSWPFRRSLINGTGEERSGEDGVMM